MSTNNSPGHPGPYVRSKLPANLSIKEAAKRLGVGRPALSNFLNAKASLSREMAGRLAATFKLDAEELLRMQAAYDAVCGVADVGKAVVGSVYVPAVLSIRAEQIEAWVERTPLTARSGLAALLRILVNSTGRDLTRVDFPAYENAERRGWDGTVEAGGATPWIPAGTSGWEFGCNTVIDTKANDDFAKRTIAVPEVERRTTTFIFVTPRVWKKKMAWEQQKRRAGAWHDVRAFDASDLEQWIEQSVAGQVWFAEVNGFARTGLRTLDDCWKAWSEAADPPLSRELLIPALAASRETLKSWLAAPPSKPLVISADSRAEALAFIDCLFRDTESTVPRTGDDVIVIDAPDAARKLASAAPGSMVMVAASLEVERELGTLHKSFHCIVVRPRNSVDTDPDIGLDLLSHSEFKTALEKMGLNEERVERLGRESGRSPTILRRRLAMSGAIKTPEWARNSESARQLVAATLVGAWHVASKADCEIVGFLASGRDTERDVSALVQLDDAPVWSIGNYRGVASKIDALFAIAPYMVRTDLENFLFVAECVLSERDPSLDLPEDKRWFASLYGKDRSHSGAISNGIAETLVLLAVHGNGLFFKRLGFNAEAAIAALVRRLLQPVSLERLLSQNDNLPLLAEAAPEEFLSIIARDLRNERAVMGLLKPYDSGVFGSGCHRTGLLWALETLAWRADLLVRVVDILGELSMQRIDDNWVNKPENSLADILRSWLPQTAAPIESRIAALARLAQTFPEVGWRICIAQLENHQTGSFSHRPNWRNDASGSGRGVPQRERAEFVRKAVEIALSWPHHSEQTLGDLVEHLQSLPEDRQPRVWQLIDEWAARQNDDAKKAALRERIRRYAFTRRSKKRGVSAENAANARAARQSLESSDFVIRHGWLFEQQWVEESVEDYDAENYDYRAREQRIRRDRTAAIAEIWLSGDIAAIDRLLQATGASHVIGAIFPVAITDPDAIARFAEHLISSAKGEREAIYMNALGGLLSGHPDPIGFLAARVHEGWGDKEVLIYSLCLPFRGSAWRALDEHAPHLRAQYWERVHTHVVFDDEADVNEAAERLMEAKRPLAAFHAVHHDWSMVETSRLKRLLQAVARTSGERAPIFRLSEHDVSEAFQSLNARADVTKDELATLEFQFLEVLEHGDYGIPNLESQICANPALFVQAVSMAFRRNDDGSDPDEISIQDAARREASATAAYRLLNRIKRLPGTDEHGKIDIEELKAWLKTVRAELKTLGRADIGDERIGQLLARAAKKAPGHWPNAEICEAIEWMAEEHVARGFHVAERNSRGVVWRGEGGNQERELAARYRSIAQSLAYTFPFVSTMIEGIAASYEREAQWEDTDAQVRSRLP